MSDVIKLFAEKAPHSPGVYLYKNKDGLVIYVGKAKDLKKRIYSYLKESEENPKTAVLVKQIFKIDIIETTSEIEALVLESNLIKKHRPKYNIRLKDDKSYPYIKLDMTHKWPRFEIVRRIKKDRSKYFGPYPNATALRQTLEMIYQTFPFRRCKDSVFKISKKPCVYYQMHRCLAPCSKDTNVRAYKKMLNAAIDVLNGDIEPVIAELEREMLLASDNQDFEEAGRIRDSIEALRITTSKQSVMFPNDHRDVDFVSYMNDGEYHVVNILFVRQGRLIGQGNRLLTGVGTIEDTITRFVIDYYKSNMVPEFLVLPCKIIDLSVQEFLKERSGKTVKILFSDESFVGLDSIASKNMDEFLRASLEQQTSWTELSKSLAEVLKLTNFPVSIECFDMSNMMGKDAAGSRVVFENGIPRKDRYRRYKIKGFYSGNDLKMMDEVLRRRINDAIEDPVSDIVMLDGGVTQLGILRHIIEELKLDKNRFAAISIAKDRDVPKAMAVDKIYFIDASNEIIKLKVDEKVLKFLQRVRNEAHRFVLNYHRKLRDSVE